jgi:hypothetical protein
VILDSARRWTAVQVLARWLLGLGIATTLAANVAHGLGHGPVGAAVAAWPAVALVGSDGLLMLVIRSSQAASDATSGKVAIPEPLQQQAAEIFVEQIAFHRSASSALNYTSVSPGLSGCATTSLRGLPTSGALGG